MQTQSTAEKLIAMEEVTIDVQRIAENATEIARTTSVRSQQVVTANANQLGGITRAAQATNNLTHTSQELQLTLGKFKI